MAYLEASDDDGCVFCGRQSPDTQDDLVIERSDLVYSILNKYPYAPRHVLVCPYRHVASWSDLDADERGELLRASRRAGRAIERAYQPDRPPVTANAKRGVMNAEGSIIDLYGDAFIVRQAGVDPAKDPRMTAASQYFQLLVNDDIVKTDKAVQLTRGPSVMTANGLIFNNVTREVQLLGNVHGTIIMNSPGRPPAQ